AFLDDPRQTAVDQAHHVRLAALATKTKLHGMAGDVDVPVAQRGDTVRLVRSSVFLVAYSNQRGLEQAHHRRERLLARHAAAAQVPLDSAPKPGKAFAERDELIELRGVTHFAPGRVIAILLAPTRVAADGLDVSARRG